jgi:hypothetical protein
VAVEPPVIGGESTPEKGDAERYQCDLSDHSHGKSAGSDGWR